MLKEQQDKIDAGFDFNRTVDVEEAIDDSAKEMFKGEEDNFDFLKIDSVSDWDNAIDWFEEKEDADGCSW